MKIKLVFKWYYLCIGFYWDKMKKDLYFFPVPMFGIQIIFPFSMPAFLRKITEG